MYFSLKSDLKQANAVGRSQCENEVKLYCSDVPPGGGRISACLSANQELLSTDCQRSNARNSIVFGHTIYLQSYFNFVIYQIVFTIILAVTFILYNRFVYHEWVKWKNLQLDVMFFIFNLCVTQFISLIITVYSLEIYVKYFSLEWMNKLLLVGDIFKEYNVLNWVFYLLVMDFLGYLTHRALHSKYLWKFHAAHHSSTAVDWSSNYRAHPFDLLFQSVLISLSLCVLGLKGIKIPWLFYVIILQAVFVHSKVNIRLGLLSYIFVSPQFHRQHHAIGAETSRGRNYAAMFVFWDLLFKTAKFDFDKQSDMNFGIREPIPSSLADHMIYPLRKIFK